MKWLETCIWFLGISGGPVSLIGVYFSLGTVSSGAAQVELDLAMAELLQG